MRLPLAVTVLLFPSICWSSSQFHSQSGPQNIRSPHAQMLRSLAITDATLVANKSFDFIVVGGGVAGLAIASRLTEWTNITVLVVEAGTDGSEFEDRINMPGKAYQDGLSASTYSWMDKTANQTYAANNIVYWPRGKGLGGSGAINGAFWCRGSKQDYGAWDTLQNDSNSVSWGWATMQKYIMKSENFTPMPDADANKYSITHDASAHGTNGPIRTSYSAYLFPIISTWVPTLKALALPHVLDPANGDNHGVSMVPSTINPTNSSRSDSKAGYCISTGAVTRSNLVVLTSHQVVRLLWNDTTPGRATVGGVIFESAAGTGENTAFAAREVILAAGTIGSPQILQLSGVGSKAHLAGMGIDTVIDLPGVGQNLQDHASATMTMQSTANPTWFALKDPTFAEAEAVKWREGSLSMWSYLNDATAYPSTMDLFGYNDGATWSQGVKEGLAGALSGTTDVTGMDSTVAKGVEAQYALTAEMLASGDIGQVEMIFNMLGGTMGAIGMQVSMQRAFSRGTVLINSPSAFTSPTINPNYYANNWDLDIMRAGIRYLIKTAQTKPMSDQITAIVAPLPDSTDDEINTYLKATTSTGFHPAGTCSMLPLASGGVTNTTLFVYGTTNLRVADASIIPLNIAAHLMATTYGIAEHASDLIKSNHLAVSTASTTQSPSESSTESSDPASTAAGHSAQNLSTGAKAGIGAGVGLVCLIGLLMLFLLCCRKKHSPADNGWQPHRGDPSGLYVKEAYHPHDVPLAPYAKHRSFHSRGDSTTTFDSTHSENQQHARAHMPSPLSPVLAPGLLPPSSTAVSYFPDNADFQRSHDNLSHGDHGPYRD